jgi:hypothetical protein
MVTNVLEEYTALRSTGFSTTSSFLSLGNTKMPQETIYSKWEAQSLAKYCF